jgi:predicted TIM-barrel fold metal-dependent hydrolase
MKNIKTILILPSLLLLTSGNLMAHPQSFTQEYGSYAGYSPSDPIFEPYWTIAEQHNIQVGIHTGASFAGV